MSPVDLEDLVRYVGLTVSLVGAFVVSPTAAVDLVRRSRTAVLAAARRAAGYLGLVTPTPQNVSVGSGIGLTSGVGTVTATSNAWIENDTLEQKIERLRNRIDGIDEQLRQTREEMRADKQAAQQALNEARAHLQAEVAVLTERITRNEHAALETDRRALPVVGLGVLLSGLAPELASRPWVAVLFMLAAAAIAVRAVLDARRDRAVQS